MEPSRKLSFFPPHASSSKPMRPVYKPFSLEEQQLFLQKQYPELLSEELRPTAHRNSLLASSEPTTQAKRAEEAPSTPVTHGRAPSRGSHALFGDQSHLPGGREWFSPSVPSWLTGKPLSPGFAPRRSDEGLSSSPLPNSNPLTSLQGVKTSLFGPISPSAAAAAVFSGGISASEEVSQLLRESTRSTTPSAQQPSTPLSPKEKPLVPVTDANTATAEPLLSPDGIIRSPTIVSVAPEKPSADLGASVSTIDEVARTSPQPETPEPPAQALHDELEPTTHSGTLLQSDESAAVPRERGIALVEETTPLGVVTASAAVDQPVTHSDEVSAQPPASVQEEQPPQDHINIALEVAYAPLQVLPRTQAGPSPTSEPLPTNSTVQQLAQAIQTLEVPCTTGVSNADELARCLDSTSSPEDQLVPATEGEDSLHNQRSPLAEQPHHLPAAPDASPRAQPSKANDLETDDVDIGEAADMPDAVAAPLPPVPENNCLALPSEVSTAVAAVVKLSECSPATDVEMKEADLIPVNGTASLPLPEITAVHDIVNQAVSCLDEAAARTPRSAEGELPNHTAHRAVVALPSPQKASSPTLVPSQAQAAQQRPGVVANAVITPATLPAPETTLSVGSNAKAVVTLAAMTPTAPMEASAQPEPTLPAGVVGSCSRWADPPTAEDAMVIIEFSPLLDNGTPGDVPAKTPMSGAQNERPPVPAEAYASAGLAASPAHTPAAGPLESKPTLEVVHAEEEALSLPVSPTGSGGPLQESNRTAVSSPEPIAAEVPLPEPIGVPIVMSTAVKETVPTVQQLVCEVPDVPGVPYAPSPPDTPTVVSSSVGCSAIQDVSIDRSEALPPSMATYVMGGTADLQIQAPPSTAAVTHSSGAPGEGESVSVPDMVLQGPRQPQDVTVQPDTASGGPLPATPSPLNEITTPPNSQPPEPASARRASPSDATSPPIDNSLTVTIAEDAPSAGDMPATALPVIAAEELPQTVPRARYAILASPAITLAHAKGDIPKIHSELALPTAPEVAPTPAAEAAPAVTTGDRPEVHGPCDTSDSRVPSHLEAGENPEPVLEPKERSITKELEELLRGGDSLQEDFSDMELDCDIDLDENSDADTEAERGTTESSKPSKPLPTLTAPLAALLPPQRLENIETFLEKVIAHSRGYLGVIGLYPPPA